MYATSLTPDAAVDEICVRLIQTWESSRRPGAELQKKGTNSLTITGCDVYVHGGIYLCGGVGRDALNCHPKATNKKQNILTRWSLRVRVVERRVSCMGRGRRTIGERKTAVISWAN